MNKLRSSRMFNMSLRSLFSTSLILCILFIEINHAANNGEAGPSNRPAPTSSDESVTSSEETAAIVEKVPRILDEFCSEEGLILFNEINRKIDVFLAIDPYINDKICRYKHKCLFTFIANLYPFWSNDQIRSTLNDWADIADTQLNNFNALKLRHLFTDISFVHRFQSILDPKFDPHLEKKLHFIEDVDTGMSQSTTMQLKMKEALNAFANGLSGYCWPMQSGSFVLMNRLMEQFLVTFYQGTNEDNVRNQLFSSWFLNRSFNLYSICKNIQRSLPNDISISNVSIRLPKNLAAVAILPLLGVSSKDAFFVNQYMLQLKNLVNSWTPQKTVSFASIEETLPVIENPRLRDYLQYETVLAKDIVMVKASEEENRPINIYRSWYSK